MISLMSKIQHAISICRWYQHNSLSQFAVKTLVKRMNHDLRKFSIQLRVNKLSLNVGKKKLVVFQRQNTKLNNSFKFKLVKRLFSTTSVKYLGVLLDEHLTWSPQVSHVQMKLNQVIGIISKIRYQANINALNTVHNSLFWSHLLYACQLWGQNNLERMINFCVLRYSWSIFVSWGTHDQFLCPEVLISLSHI